MHLPRLLDSIKSINAPVFVLDSGSDDNTIKICQDYDAVVLQHPFENHPLQWDYALKNFKVETPWLICLDADQIVTPELKERLSNFRDEDYRQIDGIYFNRKNIFKGKWLRHGGYYPFYLLKMIRNGVGYSDLNENMDHRFIVPGKTIIWKDGHIIEENLKENKIRFWIEKHNRYSDLVAQEEVERMQAFRTQTVKPQFWGSPDERTAFLKSRWWKMPRYVRPTIYFIYRMFFQLGILDGRTGVIFHFLQAFWFRLVVDIKIDEILSSQKSVQKTNYGSNNEPTKFLLSFGCLFAAFYYFNIIFDGITTEGNYYNVYLANHLNYIAGLRTLLLSSSANILTGLGYPAITNSYKMLIAGHGILKLTYSCLGLGLISFFAAFVLAYPKKWQQKIIFLISGIVGIEILNVARFVLIAIFWNHENRTILDQHTLFSFCIYILIAIALFLWVKSDKPIQNAAN
jgi:exosortase/archaeosortase family protein